MSFAELVGKTLLKVAGEAGDDQIVLTDSEGNEYVMYHESDCCESVRVYDICGDVADLLDTPILSADESTSDTDPEGVTREFRDDSQTWTFYRFQTIKGAVVIRWLGESNGYYSERVTFAKR